MLKELLVLSRNKETIMKYNITDALKDMKDAQVLGATDPEAAHIAADKILQLALKVLASNQTIEVKQQVESLLVSFSQVNKWYS